MISSGCGSVISKYCHVCNKYVSTYVKPREETYILDDVPITETINVRFCSICYTDLFDEELDQKSMELFYEKHKQIHCI